MFTYPDYEPTTEDLQDLYNLRTQETQEQDPVYNSLFLASYQAEIWALSCGSSAPSVPAPGQNPPKSGC